MKVSVEWRNEFFCFVKKFRKKTKRNMKMRETFELNEMKGGESGKSAENGHLQVRHSCTRDRDAFLMSGQNMKLIKRNQKRVFIFTFNKFKS